MKKKNKTMFIIILLVIASVGAIMYFGKEKSIGQFTTQTACNTWVNSYWDSPQDYYCSCCKLSGTGLWTAECKVDTTNVCVDTETCSNQADFGDICNICGSSTDHMACFTELSGDRDIYYYNACNEVTGIATECPSGQICDYDNNDEPYCKTAQSCSDSDGRDIHVNGYTLLEDGFRNYDICVNSATVREHQCGYGGDPNSPYYEDINCPNGEVCDNGKCVAQTQETCVDTDSGLNYNLKGTTTKGGTVKTDFCEVAPNSNILNEFWCDGNTLTQAGVSCASEFAGQTCIDGSCKVAPNNGNLSGHFENVVVPTKSGNNRKVIITGDYLADKTGRYLLECDLQRGKDKYTGLTIVSSASVCDGNKRYPGAYVNMTAGQRYQFEFTATPGFWGGDYFSSCYAFTGCNLAGGKLISDAGIDAKVEVSGLRVWQGLLIGFVILGVILLVIGSMATKKKRGGGGQQIFYVGKRGNMALTFGLLLIIAAVAVFGYSYYRNNYDDPNKPKPGEVGMNVKCDVRILNEIGSGAVINNLNCYNSGDCRGGFSIFTKGIYSEDVKVVMREGQTTLDEENINVLETIFPHVDSDYKTVSLNSCRSKVYHSFDICLYEDDGTNTDCEIKSVSP